MAYEDFQDLTTRTASDKILHKKIFNIAKKLKWWYQHGLAWLVYKLFDKETSGGTAKNGINSNKQLAEELQKPVIRTFEKRKVNSPFIDNIWGADLADMQLIANLIKDFYFLSCVIDVYSKYAWVIHLTKGIKKELQLVMLFKKF